MQIPKFPKLSTMPALTRLKARVEGNPKLASGIAAIKSNPTRARRALMVGTTFLIAIAAGHFMQGASNDAAKPPVQLVTQAALVPPAAVVIAAVTQPAEAVRAGEAVDALPAAPRPSNIGEHKDHAGLVLPKEPMVAGIDVVSFEAVAPEATPNAQALNADCAAPELRLTEQPNGIIGLNVYTPCFVQTEFLINQLDVKFKVTTDADGRYIGTMPALTQTPVVQAHLSDGMVVSERIIFAETINSERVAVVWEGSKDLALNAFEYGADFGGAGHVWAQTPRLPGTAMGGYLTRLGDPDLAQPAMADVYIAPAGLTDVKFDVEAQVTAATCDRDISATLLRAAGTGTPSTEALSIAMPDCDALGDAIILPLRDQDLEFAMAQ
jgi:hypothetical protein